VGDFLQAQLSLVPAAALPSLSSWGHLFKNEPLPIPALQLLLVASARKLAAGRQCR
jgi:hypothetical protein